MHTLSRVLLEQNFLKPVQPSLGYELQHQGHQNTQFYSENKTGMAEGFIFLFFLNKKQLKEFTVNSTKAAQRASDKSVI